MATASDNLFNHKLPSTNRSKPRNKSVIEQTKGRDNGNEERGRGGEVKLTCNIIFPALELSFCSAKSVII